MSEGEVFMQQSDEDAYIERLQPDYCPPAPGRSHPVKLPTCNLSVEDALEGLGTPSERALVLALEVEQLRARLEECHKFRNTLIRRIANRDLPAV